MPALAFLAAVGLALIAMMFVADATLEPSLPPIVTSDRVGLPEPWHSDDILAPTPAPAPEAVQPQSAPDLAKIESAARAARAEAPPKKKRVTQQPDHQQNHFQQDNLVDRFSIRGQ